MLKFKKISIQKMKSARMLSVFGVLFFWSAQALAGIFPYMVAQKILPNGLEIVVIETPEFKEVLSFNTMVLAGSGKEEERGRTGLAHLFEHILFRHRFGGVEGGYDEAINRLGAHNNAWTWFDVTYYHPLTFASKLERQPESPLPGLLELESSRFLALDFSQKTFQTEAGAVLGEYRRGASFPSEKMSERLSVLMFPHHPYGHTTMGYYDDVVDMPNHFEAARRFYETYYRPNNCVLVIAGDIKASEIFKKVEPWYRNWKPAAIPILKTYGEVPHQEQREHVPWDADVAPLVWVSYRMPAFRLGSAFSAAAELLSELIVSQAAPLYKKLRYENQVASALSFEEGTQGFESTDPRSLIVSAELFKEKYAKKGKVYFDEVSADIIAGLEEFKDFASRPGAKDLLKAVKSKYRYDFLAQLDSPASIAKTFSWYYRFGHDPKVLDRLLDSVAAVEPQDLERLARSAFVPANRVILTLAYEPAAKKVKP
jgi:zinc protease